MPKDKKEKKSKKQKKKELEEKRRLEEELLRQQQEEERKRQEELERQRREEEERQRLLREKKRAEELVRLVKEREEDVEVEEQWHSDLVKFEREQFEQSEWKKHLKCSTVPDISKEREMNDFLTEWKEYGIFERIDHEFEIKRLDHYIADIERGYNLLPILHDVIYDAIQRRDDEKLKIAKTKFIEIGQIAQHKIDVLTAKCLRDPVFMAVAESGLKADGDTMRHGMCRHFKWGLWASSMSNAFKNSKLSFPPPISVRVELPKQLAMRARQPLSCRIVQTVPCFEIADGGQFECISPVINLELFRLPMAPQSMNDESSGSWMVQDVTEQTLTPTVWRHKKEDGAISVKFVVPQYVVVSDPKQPSIGWWHPESRQWRVDGDDQDDGDKVIENIRYEAAKRVLSVTTRRVTPLCMVQPIGTWNEYKEWKLTPSGVQRCKIWLLTASKMVVEMEVVGGHCQLLQPQVPALNHLLRKMQSPHHLIGALRDCGLNLCSKNDAKMSPRLLSKDEEIEDRAHREISSVAALFQIAMSRWNREAEPNNERLIIFRLRKPLTPNEEADLAPDHNEEADSVADDEKWQSVMINHEKCSFIESTERSKTVNLETPIRELSHHSLLRCVASKCTEDNTRDLQNTSFRFKETIRRMLNLLNLFRV